MHLIPLRWVNARGNDSLYWYDIASFTTTPRKFERQTPQYLDVEDVNDYVSAGIDDMLAYRYDFGPEYVLSPLTETE
jgi:hypothetical protein